ncbi:DinB family protein [Neolewinella lacunae]|uniref:Damage-inducible protein DinB n=1 Tax=Neolewinella lacunae TaxID=1517758 RepID=A0A923TBP6_9BACT|nr:DinB family protein [Neolewinella lacunae]MBC6992832.1 damage-inducible protein DinB [Neolewinella lacunae]MDN3633859.1 DinB family protein [Neolewinella lacunae]
MESAANYAIEQYELVQASRKVLLDYCKTIHSNDFLNENSSFGRGGSIRNLLTHIANTYEFWIAKHGLNRAIEFTPYGSIQTINDAMLLFEKIDAMVFEFIGLVDSAEKRQIHFEINGVKSHASPFKLFTHVITHEFHHKGQILSISRHLGYIPVDTDIMR